MLRSQSSPRRHVPRSSAPPAPERQWVLRPSARPGGLISHVRSPRTTARSPLPHAVWQCALSTVMCSSIWFYPEPELEGESGVDVNAVRSGQVSEPLTPRPFLTSKLGTLPFSPA
ncbi:hypothetical protein B0H13DRAFT_2325628 [Mycena leptocephala]|nr:hypothetical protein B0H13DRAFT_2325628 [Mycena leptocephala]